MNQVVDCFFLGQLLLLKLFPLLPHLFVLYVAITFFYLKTPTVLSTSKRSYEHISNLFSFSWRPPIPQSSVLLQSGWFFLRHGAELSACIFCCHSTLLDSQIPEFLDFCFLVIFWSHF